MFRLLLFLFVYERKRLVPIVSFARINQVVPITKNKPSSNKHTMQNLTSQTIRYVFNHAWNVIWNLMPLCFKSFNYQKNCHWKNEHFFFVFSILMFKCICMKCIRFHILWISDYDSYWMKILKNLEYEIINGIKNPLHNQLQSWFVNWREFDFFDCQCGKIFKR